MGFEEDMIEKISTDLQSQLEKIVIEGLRLKGHVFHREIDLHDFIKNRCSCLDNQQEQQKIYSIDSEPFLLHNYKPDMEFSTERPYTVSANLGTYTYL